MTQLQMKKQKLLQQQQRGAPTSADESKSAFEREMEETKAREMELKQRQSASGGGGGGGGMAGLLAGISGGAGRLKVASARTVPVQKEQKSQRPGSAQFEDELAQRIQKQKATNINRKSQQELPPAILEFERAASRSKPAPARVFRWGEVDPIAAIKEDDEGSADDSTNTGYSAARNGLKPASARAGAGAGAGAGASAAPTAKSTRKKGGIAKSFRKSIKNLFQGKRNAAPSKQLPKAPANWTRPAISNPVASATSNTQPTSTILLRRPGTVTVAEIDAGMPEDDEFETLDARAIDAARWTDKVILQLIGEIKKRGSVGESGLITVKFGKLFDETADIFDALVGILKTAKKYNVCTFNKDQMWQGADDNEVITLLKDTHDGILINRRKVADLRTAPAGIKTTGFGAASGATQQKKCHACNKTVYPMEYLGASGKTFHKSCFRCATCNNVLKATSFCTADSVSFFCEPHYKEMILSAGGLSGGREAYSIKGGGQTIERKLSGASLQSRRGSLV